MPQCPACKDTGYITWEKPMGAIGNLTMVPMFAPCIQCEAGRKAMEWQTNVTLNIPITPSK